MLLANRQTERPGNRRQPVTWLLMILLLNLWLSACAANRYDRPRTGTSQRGIASWYGEPFHGRATASGEIYDMHGLTAAHKEFPLGTVVDVTNLENGKKLRVRINDRGPFIRGRIIDLSYGAAQKLDVVGPGTAKVRVEVVRIGAGPSGPATATRFAIQLGAFSSIENARALQQKAAKEFPNTELASHDGIHRIRLSPYRTRKDAEKDLARLRRAGFSALIVTLN